MGGLHSVVNFLIGITFRSNAAVLSKTLHVTSEAFFLAAITVAFGLPVIAGAVIVTSVVTLLLTLTMPCFETIEVAARTGMVLDAINFLSYAWYGLTRPNDYQLWTFIWGLGFHALYLIAAITVSREHGSPELLLGLRIIGLYANIIASEFFLLVARRELGLATSGRVKSIKAWQNMLKDVNTPLCIWTTRGLRVIAPVHPDPYLSNHSHWAAPLISKAAMSI